MVLDLGGCRAGPWPEHHPCVAAKVSAVAREGHGLPALEPPQKAESTCRGAHMLGGARAQAHVGGHRHPPRHRPGVSSLALWKVGGATSQRMNIYQLVIWEHDVKEPSAEAFMEREAKRNVQSAYF